MSFSKALETVARGYGLVDVWETVPLRAAYTHYTSHGAARLDRTYIISNLSAQKLGVETVVAACTYCRILPSYDYQVGWYLIYKVYICIN